MGTEEVSVLEGQVVPGRDSDIGAVLEQGLWLPKGQKHGRKGAPKWGCGAARSKPSLLSHSPGTLPPPAS